MNNKKEEKKKLNKYQKNKIIMKTVAWIMAILMILGVIASFLSFFIAR